MARNIIASGLVVDEALTDVSLADRISVPSQRTLTDAGQMHVPCKFARTGIQLYTAKQLGLADVAPTKVIEVHRDEATVFDEASMETFRSAPVTMGHPKDEAGSPVKLTADNAKELQVGMLEGMPVRDEDTLGGMLVLTAQEAIDALEDGTQELSAGYVCDIEEIDGAYFQRNIRANHIAIVEKGRAGSSCRISDEALEVRLADEHPEPMRGDFTTDEAFEGAVKCWKLAVASEGSLTADDALALNDELEVQKQLVVDFKEAAEKAEVAVEAMKVELADAKVAAEEGVVERCNAIENARLIADMRDLGDKSVAQIKELVVKDQYPDKDFTGKSESYFDAMFEILVDQSKGETPMSKLMKTQESHVVVDAKPEDPVAAARKNMIKRQAGQTK